MRLATIVRRVVLPCLVLVGVVSPAASPPPGAQPATQAPHQRLLREIYQELIEINATDSVGDNTKAAEAMARRLLAAGFPAADVQGLAPAPRTGNLVARLHGTGARRPLLLLAPLDVVEANREDWSVDPLTLLEFDFPVRLDDVNRTFFERTAAIASGTLADDMRAIAAGSRDPQVVGTVAGAGPVFISLPGDESARVAVTQPTART